MNRTLSHFARRSTATAIVAITALIALSACTPTPAPPSASSTPTSGSSAGSSTAPAPTPTATTASIAPPVVRIPLGCDAIASSAALTTATATTMTPGTIASGSDLLTYVGIQDGALNCDWDGPTVSGSSSANYTVMVIPDATSAWAKYYSENLKYSILPVSFLGQKSYGNCYSNNDPGDKAQGCNVDVLVGSVWLDLVVSTSAVTGTLTDAQLYARFGPLLKGAVTAVTGITVSEPAWSDPTAKPVTLPAAGGTFKNPGLKTAIGVNYFMEVESPYYDINGAVAAEMIPVGYRMDGGSGSGEGGTVTPATDYGMTISILPQGAWAFPQITAADSGYADYTPISGLGDQAFSYTSPDNSFGSSDVFIEGTSGGNLFEIEVGDDAKPGEPNSLTLAKAAAAYVVTELG